MSKKQLISLALLALLIGTIPVGVLVVRQQQELRGRAAPATTLSLAPSNVSPQIGQTFTVSVNIDTGTNQVVGVQLSLTFDAGKIQAQDIVPGSFFTSPQTLGKAIDNTVGTLAYTLFLSPGSTPQSGQGTVAVITFQAIGSGSAAIAISESTKVGASQEGVNVLQTRVPTTVTVAEATSPTSTPTPTTATSQPTSTPTPTTSSSGTSGGGGSSGGGGDSSSSTGGGGSSAQSATPTPTPQTTANLKAQSTKTITPTPTTVKLPEAGVSLPMFGLIGAGFILLTTGLLFAF